MLLKGNRMIYLVKAVGTQYVKIGVASNPIARIRGLQTGMPTDLTILAAAYWPDSNERRLHRVLRQYRTRGEWFVLPYDILQGLVAHMQSGARNADAWITTLPAPHRLAKVLSIAR